MFINKLVQDKELYTSDAKYIKKKGRFSKKPSKGDTFSTDF